MTLVSSERGPGDEIKCDERESSKKYGLITVEVRTRRS